jgi:hypothetical protein
MDNVCKLLNNYIENIITIRELKISLLDISEKNIETYSKKISSVFILIDSYDERHSYHYNNRFVYALKKILYLSGIGEDPITEIEIKNRLKKILKNWSGEV